MPASIGPALRRRHRRAALHQFRPSPGRHRNADRSPARRIAHLPLRLDRTGLLMAEEADMDAEEAPARRSRWRTAAKWAGIAVAALLLLVAIAFVGINTDPGRRYVVRPLHNLEIVSELDNDNGRRPEERADGIEGVRTVLSR